MDKSSVDIEVAKFYEVGVTSNQGGERIYRGVVS